MKLQTLEHQTGASPVASLIMLHGLGADGHDFEPLVQEIDLGAVGPVRWVFPHAPVRPVTINGGMSMRAWYDILGLDFTRRGEDEPGLRESLEAVRGVLAQERSRGMASERIVLAGFSQGCAMALLTGLRHPEPLAGIVGLSGYLPRAAQTASERSEQNARTRLFMAHGRQDPVVPYAAGLGARDVLQALGHEVQWHGYDMPHAVCAEELQDLQQWLVALLA